MAQSNVLERFKDKNYLNWIKLVQALACVGDGLLPFCVKVVDEVHESLRKEIGHELCKAKCTPKTLGTGKEKRWYIDCPNDICNKWLDRIVAELYENQCSWRHTDLSMWPTQSWQLAKIFMGPGKQPSKSAPSKTDSVGLLQLIINCKAFHDLLLKQKASQVMFCFCSMFILYHNNKQYFCD